MAELKDKLQAAFDKFSALDEKTKAAIEEKIKAAIDEKQKGLLSLEIVDVTGTKDKFGKDKEKDRILMTTGSSHWEGHCYYKVDWKKRTVVSTGLDTTETKEEKGNGNLQFALNILNVRFVKKMYSPNEILVEVQMAPGSEDTGDVDGDVTYIAKVKKDVLEASFINKKVVLRCEGEVVCNDYYIHEIIPVYKSDAMYVTFRIFSPDYLLTQSEYCRTFVGKKLGSDILAKEISNYLLPYDSSSNVSVVTDNMKHIKKNGAEHLFPYLVQYNESFYDFLKRTTNRWGEFMYYEDGKLNIGYAGGSAPDGCMDKVDTVTYEDLTNNLPEQKKVGIFNSEAPIDKQILDNPIKKTDYDIVRNQINSLGNTDIGGDVYVMKKLAALLGNDKTIWSFLVDQGVDDTIAYLMAKKNSDDLNDAYDQTYFTDKKKDNVVFLDAQYNSDKNQLNLFSEITPILNLENYAKIVKKEVCSGRNAIVFDFDTTYPNIKLGQILTYDNQKYLVVQVEGYQPQKMKIVNNEYFEHVVDTKKVVYKVTAIPQNRVKDNPNDTAVTDTTYYPQVIPEGHVRRSGAQLAKVVDVDDPKRCNRVRVKFDWQQSDSDESIPSPWLIYTSTAATSGNGVHGKHYKDELVLVDFVSGNVERPYVVGAVEPKTPVALQTNDIVYKTPGGQSIKMGDGYGAGLAALLASFNPGTKMLQGFFPTFSFGDFKANKSLEGSIEMGDKYGFWSIKGCTNDRNITIKSPWGDVKINAFTGITLNAPNGDIKIKGKNVSIEAGGNLTLTSGKNIKQKFLMDGEDINLVSIASTITKTVTSKVASMLVNITDLSLLRHFCEVFFKPVEGKIQITSGRYLMLEAGGKKTGYPIEAYKDCFKGLKSEDDSKMVLIVESFEKLKGQVNQNYDNQELLYNVAQAKKARLAQLINNCNDNGVAQCKGLDDVLTALWNNPTQDAKTLMAFEGLYKDITKDDNPDIRIIAKFLKINAGTIAGLASPDNLKNLWKRTVVLQQRAKVEITNTVTALGSLISQLKDFELVKAADNYKDLNAVLTVDNLPDESLLKSLKDDANFKNFTAAYQPGANEKKLAYRKLFIALVNKFKFERSAMEGGGLLTQPKVFEEPAYDCSDDDWGKYVKSILTLKTKDDKSTLSKVGSAIGEAILDPLKGMFDYKGIKNALDDWTYGSSKKGQILFASGDGTMVLDKDIYRANVGGLDLNSDSGNPNDPQGNGFATRVRNAMLG